LKKTSTEPQQQQASHQAANVPIQPNTCPPTSPNSLNFPSLDAEHSHVKKRKIEHYQNSCLCSTTIKMAWFFGIVGIDWIIFAVTLLLAVYDLKMSLYFGWKQIAIIPALIAVFSMWCTLKNVFKFALYLAPLLVVIGMAFHFNVVCFKDMKIGFC